MLLQVDGWPVIRSWAERAEEQGWDDLWVADHFTAVPGMPYLDGWSLLAHCPRSPAGRLSTRFARTH